MNHMQIRLPFSQPRGLIVGYPLTLGVAAVRCTHAGLGAQKRSFFRHVLCQSIRAIQCDSIWWDMMDMMSVVINPLWRVASCFSHKDCPSVVQSTSATRDPGLPLNSSISLSQSGFSFLQWPGTIGQCMKKIKSEIKQRIPWFMIFLLIFPPVLTRVQGIWWKHSSLLFPPKQSRIQVSRNRKIWRFEELNTVCQKHNETKRIWQVQILYQRHEQLSQARPNSSPKAAHKHGRNFNIQYMQPTKQLLRGHSGFVQTRFVPRICELKSGCAAEQSRNDDCVDHPDVNDAVTYL